MGEEYVPPAGRREDEDATSDIEQKTQEDGKTKATGRRRYLSAEKKCQLFMEAEKGEQQIGGLLRREGLYPSDLARIREHVKEGALKRLKARPAWIRNKGSRRF